MSRNEFFRDFIVTSPDGVWVDGRAYATLNAAVAAVGANEQTIVIASEQVITTITIPVNVTLKFEHNGSISNSAAMIILTTKIIAPNRQIFTGVGNITFSFGSELRSSWFASFEEAVTRIAHAEVTLVVSEPRLVAANCTVGSGTSLKWESPNAMLTADAGITVDGLQHIEAGSFQLFAGAGTFTFDDHCQLKLSWFPRLRSAITWIDTSEVVLHIDGTHIVDFSDTAPYNISFDFKTARGHIEVLVGLTLIIKGDVYGGFFRIFSGDGDVVCSRGFSVTAIGMASLLGSTLDFGDVWPGNVSLQGFYEPGDDGGGDFYWDSLELKDDHNGGTIIDPHHTALPGDAAWYAGVGIGGVGCWKRINGSSIAVAAFGAVGATNDTVRIEACINAANTENITEVVFKSISYTLDMDTEFNNLANLVINGNGAEVTLTNNGYTDTEEALFRFIDCSDIKISGFNINEGFNTNQRAFFLYFQALVRSMISNNILDGVNIGSFYGNSADVPCQNVLIEYNKTTGGRYYSIYCYYIHNLIVKNNTFLETGRDLRVGDRGVEIVKLLRGADLDHIGSRVEISMNVFEYGSYPHPINADFIDTYNGGRDVFIEKNVFRGSLIALTLKSRGHTGAIDEVVCRHHVHKNLFEDVDRPVSIDGLHSLYYTENTHIDCGSTMTMMWLTHVHPMENVKVCNNSFINCGYSTGVIILFNGRGIVDSIQWKDRPGHLDVVGNLFENCDGHFIQISNPQSTEPMIFNIINNRAYNTPTSGDLVTVNAEFIIGPVYIRVIGNLCYNLDRFVRYFSEAAGVDIYVADNIVSSIFGATIIHIAGGVDHFGTYRYFQNSWNLPLQGATADKPTYLLYNGQTYYDTTLSRLEVWNGAAWAAV